MVHLVGFYYTNIQGGSNMTGTDLCVNNALFHAPRYLLFAHHSSNSQTGLNRF